MQAPTDDKGKRLPAAESRRSISVSWGCSLVPARQYRDDVLFSRRHVGVLSIGDRVAHSDFDYMSTRHDLHFLGLPGDLLGWAGLHAVDEYQGTGGCTHHHQFGRLGRMGFAVKPAATRNAKQQDDKKCFQLSTLAGRKQEPTMLRGPSISTRFTVDAGSATIAPTDMPWGEK